MQAQAVSSRLLLCWVVRWAAGLEFLACGFHHSGTILDCSLRYSNRQSVRSLLTWSTPYEIAPGTAWCISVGSLCVPMYSIGLLCRNCGTLQAPHPTGTLAAPLHKIKRQESVTLRRQSIAGQHCPRSSIDWTPYTSRASLLSSALAPCAVPCRSSCSRQPWGRCRVV